MNSYNGFSPTQRTTALRWLNGEYAAGRRTRPTSCDVCGQTRGLLQAHSEDYSGPPFGDNIGAFGLCYRCHMIIHCRFGNPWAFERYAQSLELGQVWPPTRQDWGEVKRMLAGPAGDPILAERSGGEPRLLRAIAAGHYLPPRNTSLETPGLV